MNKTNTISHEILHGPLVPTSIKLAIPVLIGQLLLLLYGTVDTIFISMLNKTSTSLMAGVGLIFPIYMLFIALGSGLFTGISSLTARSFGEKNHKTLEKMADNGLFLAVLISLITLTTLYLTGKNLIHFLAGSQLSTDAVTHGLDYFYYIIPGFGLLLVQMSLLGVTQGEGKVHYYGITIMISTILNIILDPIFIFVFKLGVAGAALATTLSIAVSLLFVITLFITKKSTIPITLRINPLDKKILSEILRIGIPNIVGMIALSFAIMILNNLISSISEEAMNAWVLVGRTDEFLLMLGYAFGNSALTLVGQNFGAKNHKRVFEAYKVNITIGIAATIIFAVIYNLAAVNIFSLFTSVPAVIENSVRQVRILSFTFTGLVTSIIVTFSFQAIGKALPGLIMICVRMGALTIPLAYIIVKVYNKGMDELFYLLAGINVLMLIASFIWGYLVLKNKAGDTAPVDAPSLAGEITVTE